MKLSFRPDVSFHGVTDIKPEFLRDRGVRLLLLDIDNTISPYGQQVPAEDICRWAEDMKAAGVALYFVSNNKGNRPEIFSRQLGVPYLKAVGKPSRRGIYEAMARTGAKASETALVGDQIYTDVLAANRAGIMSLLVEPIKFTNPLLAIRYFFELPFRSLAKERIR